MKNKILAMLVAFGLVGSVSAIEINENLSINGFIDGSITKTDSETAGNDSANWDSTKSKLIFSSTLVPFPVRFTSTPITVLELATLT